MAGWMKAVNKSYVRLKLTTPLPKWPVRVAQRRGRRRTIAKDEFQRCRQAAIGAPPIVVGGAVRTRSVVWSQFA